MMKLMRSLILCSSVLIYDVTISTVLDFYNVWSWATVKKNCNILHQLLKSRCANVNMHTKDKIAEAEENMQRNET